MRASMQGIAGALALGGLVFAGAGASAQTTVDAIAATLQAQGPAATLSHYFQCSGGEGYPFVAGGNPHAVAIAATLLPHADGCEAKRLVSSLRLALIYNPAIVLRVVNSEPQLAADEICTPSGLPADAPKADDATVAQEMKGSLGTVTNPKLAARKQACLRAIAG